MTLPEFEVLVLAHDMTYENSDSSSKYAKGRSEFRQIIQAATNLLTQGVSIVELNRIWNAGVAKRLLPDAQYLYNNALLNASELTE